METCSHQSINNNLLFAFNFFSFFSLLLRLVRCVRTKFCSTSPLPAPCIYPDMGLWTNNNEKNKYGIVSLKSYLFDFSIASLFDNFNAEQRKKISFFLSFLWHIIEMIFAAASFFFANSKCALFFFLCASPSVLFLLSHSPFTIRNIPVPQHLSTSITVCNRSMQMMHHLQIATELTLFNMKL